MWTSEEVVYIFVYTAKHISPETVKRCLFSHWPYLSLPCMSKPFKALLSCPLHWGGCYESELPTRNLNIRDLDLYYLRDQFSGVQFRIRVLYLPSSSLHCGSNIATPHPPPLVTKMRWPRVPTHTQLSVEFNILHLLPFRQAIPDKDSFVIAATLCQRGFFFCGEHAQGQWQRGY